MKSALITYKKELTINTIIDYRRKLSYDHFFVFTQKSKVEEKELKNYKKFTIIVCQYKNILEKIYDLFIKYEKIYTFFPYFIGDSNSKLSIRVYNKAKNLKIDPNVFRLKNKMNDFLGKEVSRKKFIKLSYTDLTSLSYGKIKNKLGQNFILKPVNAASSLLNFKISSAKQFYSIKKKLKKKYEYVLEELLEGNLYSLDFFSDGKNIFLLCLAREIPFAELLEKFSPHYMDKYRNQIEDKFLHFIPIRYTLDLNRLTPIELNFLKKINAKLVEKKYHGFIHLEYKIEKKKGEIGFIEWGARTGGKRSEFITGMHGLRVENLPKEILYDQDFSHFKKKNGIYFLKNKDIDKNFLMIYTSVLQKTHITETLKKIPNYLNVSFEDFLKEYLWANWKIRIKNIVFFLLTNSEGYLYPFYERSDTKFNYIMEIDENSFKLFLKKKNRILEHLVFHDYKK